MEGERVQKRENSVLRWVWTSVSVCFVRLERRRASVGGEVSAEVLESWGVDYGYAGCESKVLEGWGKKRVGL